MVGLEKVWPVRLLVAVTLLASACTDTSKSSDSTSVAPSATASAPSAPVVTPVSPSNGTPGTVKLVAVDYVASQVSGAVLIAVSKAGGEGNTVTVNYSTLDGTAQSGVDYSGAVGMLTWQPGDMSTKTIEVALNTMNVFAGAKEFSLSLSSPSSQTTLLASPSVASVIIVGAESNDAVQGSGNSTASTKSIQEWVECGALNDQSAGVAAAFQAAHQSGFTLIVDCPVRFHTSASNTQSISIEDATTVVFRGNGEFIVAYTTPSAFDIQHPDEVTLIQWNVNYL